MKSDLYTKAVLTVIAVALSVIAFNQHLAPNAVVHAQSARYVAVPYNQANPSLMPQGHAAQMTLKVASSLSIISSSSRPDRHGNADRVQFDGSRVSRQVDPARQLPISA